jgi:hypothetical protein
MDTEKALHQEGQVSRPVQSVKKTYGAWYVYWERGQIIPFPLELSLRMRASEREHFQSYQTLRSC